jgi:uncharacterized membrane protein
LAFVLEEEIMQRVTRSITINAPVRRIFDYISEPNNIPNLWSNLWVIEDIHRLPGGGKQFRWTQKFADVRFEGHSDDIEYKVNRRITRRISGGLQATVTWELEDEGDKTNVTFVIEYAIPSLLLHGGRTIASISQSYEQEIDKMLLNLREKTDMSPPADFAFNTRTRGNT